MLGRNQPGPGMRNDVYKLEMPESPDSCAVFNSPHSGAYYPPHFLAESRLGAVDIRSSEDAFVDQLIDGAPLAGAPLLCARYPRAYVDLNRSADELDPALIRNVRAGKVNPCVKAGLGVIPRVVARGQVIQSGKIGMTEAKARLDKCYHPYHAALARLIRRQKDRFGLCLLFDFHSMPHSAVRPAGFRRRAQIILGDRYGTTCDRWVSDAAFEAFGRAGFRVARNAPFAGGYITRNYGRPKQNIHALQIEIDRSLYMNEATLRPNEGWNQIREMLGQVVFELARLGAHDQSVAAE